MQLYCTITARSGDRVPLTLNDEEIAATGITPTQLRQKISTCTRIPLKDLRLIFRGRMIKDDDSIASVITEYKLENDSVLHCMGKPVEMNSSSSSSNTSTSTSTSSTSSDNSSSATAAVVPDTTTVNNRTVVPPLSTSTASVVASATATATAAAAAGSAASASMSAIAAASAAAAAAAADPLTTALTRLRQNNPPSVYATAVATLEKVLKNIVDNPLQEKYRQVKRQNAAFRKRLGGLVGGHDCMLATGFVVDNEGGGGGGGEEVYKLEASAERWNTLTQAQNAIIAASQQAKLQQQQARQQPTAAGDAFGTAMPNGGAAAAAGMGGMGGFPPASMNDPNMQNMMSQVMSNPEALGAALQNPMVQQMMRNDPNISPMLRQYMESMSSNPAMLQQMTQRMQDPAVQAQMRQAMAANGGAGGMPGMNMPGMNIPGAANSTAGSTTNNNNNSAAAPPPQNDQGQTEDDMIAEAIRRSLEGNN